MAGDVRLVWDDGAIQAIASPRNPGVAQVMEYVAGLIETGMKRTCPVSPVYQVYSKPLADLHFPGDFPLRPSGFLRSSIGRVRDSNGDILVGPGMNYPVGYAGYVNDGTAAHSIDSHGTWPLRSSATGQVFGRHVNHPGTKPTFFIQRSLEDA